MFRALDVLQMKGEGVFMFFAAGTQLGGASLDFQMEQSWHLPLKSEENLGKASAGTCAVVPLKTQPMSLSHHLGILQ